MNSNSREPLPVVRAAELNVQPPEDLWLIRSLWTRAAVGILGGTPKTGKTWMGLDMAISVASGTPCLDRFPVDHPGPALIYLAEDSLPIIRSRIESICGHRRLAIEDLNLNVITVPSLRLDLRSDQERLAATIESFRPRLLLLDPLVRMHRLEENSASEISGLLSYLRDLQRTFDAAIVLVHHASKRCRAQPGQALRGSSDLHAFGDSNAYIVWHENHVVLTVEHRAAAPPDPITLRLVSSEDESLTHLKVCEDDPSVRSADSESLVDAVLRILRHTEAPMTRKALRGSLRVNNHNLGQVLQALKKEGVLHQTSTGWILLRKRGNNGGTARLL